MRGETSSKNCNKSTQHFYTLFFIHTYQNSGPQLFFLYIDWWFFFTAYLVHEWGLFHWRDTQWFIHPILSPARMYRKTDNMFGVWSTSTNLPTVTTVTLCCLEFANRASAVPVSLCVPSLYLLAFSIPSHFMVSIFFPSVTSYPLLPCHYLSPCTWLTYVWNLMLCALHEYPPLR